MINFLLQFNSEQDAQTVLPLYHSEDGGWDTSRCIPNVQVWKTDEHGNQTPIPGWFIRIGDENAALQPLAVDEANLNTSPIFAGDDATIAIAPASDTFVPVPLPATTEPVDTRDPIETDPAQN